MAKLFYIPPQSSARRWEVAWKKGLFVGFALASNVPYAFLADGGEMGPLIRVHDRSARSFGAIETWPQNFKTAWL